MTNPADDAETIANDTVPEGDGSLADIEEDADEIGDDEAGEVGDLDETPDIPEGADGDDEDADADDDGADDDPDNGEDDDVPTEH